MNSVETKLDKVFVAITSFNPSCKLLDLIDVLHSDPEVDLIAIYDNNSSSGQEILQLIEDKYERVYIYRSKSNDGLGKAYNFLIKNYLCGQKYIMTFDQDSRIEPLFVASLKNSLEHVNISQRRVMSIGPRIISVDNINIKSEVGIKEKPILITSGNLMFTKIYEESGGFDEELFIDCVDYDFSLKLRKCGCKLVQDREICLYQDIGESKDGVRLHSNIRMFYMIRNHIRLTKRYLLEFPLYITFENLMFIAYLRKWKKHVKKEVYKNTIKQAVKEA